MPKYYTIEVDPLARVHDYSVVYYRNLDSDWNMDGLITKATIDDDSYTLEAMIPINTLKQLNLINSDGYMRIGLYRAEFSMNDDETIDMKWISWVNPKTKNPDYHVDSSFGEFRFIK